VTLQRFSGGCLSADAIRFEPVNPTDAAQWAPPAAAEYSVYAWWPAAAAHSPNAVYRVTHATGVQDFPRNQQAGGGAWSPLSTFTFTNAAGQGVKLLASTSGAVAADAVRFKPTQWSTHQRALYYYHVDHLGTPLKLTNAIQQVVWDADYEPFGAATLALSTVTQPLRFPGQ
jgi:hypothetical protein